MSSPAGYVRCSGEASRASSSSASKADRRSDAKIMTESDKHNNIIMSSTCRSTSSMKRKCTRFHEQKSHQQKHISDQPREQKSHQQKHISDQPRIVNSSQGVVKRLLQVHVINAGSTTCSRGSRIFVCGECGGGAHVCRGTSSGCTLYIQQHSCGAEKSTK